MTQWFIIQHAKLIKFPLTSTKPCATFSSTTAVGPIAMAPGIAMLKTADIAIAAPKILLAGYIEAKNPPGTCVIRYPKKYDESIEDSTAIVHSNGVSSFTPLEV